MTVLTKKIKFLVNFIDLYKPTKLDVEISIYSMIGYYAISAIIMFSFSLLTDPTVPSHDAVETVNSGQTKPPFISMLISILLASVIEELAFRNFVQKTLYAIFDYRWAIVLPSVLFAFLHIPAYGGIGSGIEVMLLTIFSGSVIYGYAYWKSGNILVPMILHSFNNVLALASLYI